MLVTLWTLNNGGKTSFVSEGEMFVTVLFGESRTEMFNINCKLIHFVHNLKERCGVDLKDCVDLMNCNGTVMNLETKQLSVDLASSLLAERQHYVLLQVCRSDNNGGQKYISLIHNVSQSHPELKELLRKVCNPGQERDKKVRGRIRRKGLAHHGWSQNVCQP
ncbi:uncharacterized protein C22orf15 isoform X1 [Phyllopteryx taeniolatus]|uniref:uncharacterized protein C22orf15 isoform X1 n=1 Tax=Phyllopteryx taeniolatus TaxID=161469 RepID=UPI002AD4E01F|nr:uncharacterized protein C22orf15 isoform X1 [Phyllopteryx taeniolatus]